MKKSNKKEYIITEGVAGYWFYHISEKNKFTKSLCGKDTMRTSIPLEQWNIKGDGHIPEKYCKECERIYKEKLNAKS
jgi:hypothetical protein